MVTWALHKHVGVLRVEIHGLSWDLDVLRGVLVESGGEKLQGLELL
jgi:hypothetical protein